MPTLRPYQQALEDDIERCWAEGAKVVLAIAPTGAGKTVTFANILQREPGASAAIAHRKELVGQMSQALARNGVRHRVVGSSDLRRQIVANHRAELGVSYYDPSARCGVVGIDSLLTLAPNDPWLSQVRTFIGDEGHHFLRENKWGRGVALFPNLARGALFTATGFRADGAGLGRGADGLADAMVQGPTMRGLITAGYLTDYRVVAPPSDIDYAAVPVTGSGDLSPQKLRAVVHKSPRIVGDVVQSYLSFAAGKLGITFAVDVEAATELAVAYRAAGVPAEVITANTPDILRATILRRFAQREILQLVNVDLFGEGFDLPAVEVVSMVRKTESKPLFDQQFGRALRLMIASDLMARWDTFTDAERRAHIAASGKPSALIIDHVGNVLRHLPPDSVRVHTLDRRDKRARAAVDPDVIPLRICANPICLSAYECVLPVCPYCGTRPVPVSRSAPEYVDGVLVEMDAALLARLRGEVTRADSTAPTVPFGAPVQVAQHLNKVHHARQEAQRTLRDAIALWSGWQIEHGRHDVNERQARFFHAFGIDVLSAQALNRADAEALQARIDKAVNKG